MGERKAYEFFVLRYVPNAVAGEFANICLVLHEPDATGGGFADVRFRPSWSMVKCFDPQVDLEMLEAFTREIRHQVVDAKQWPILFGRWKELFSNALQISGPQICLSDNPANELEQLASAYWPEIEMEAGEKKVRGRQAIVKAMKSAFYGAGLEGLVLEKFRMERYMRAGAPLKWIDFAYKANNELKLFQAVSLKTDIRDAMSLAALFPKTIPAIARDVQADVNMTAVIDDDLERGRDEIQFALGMLEEEKIRVAAVAEMPAIAERARVELRGVISY